MKGQTDEILSMVAHWTTKRPEARDRSQFLTPSGSNPKIRQRAHIARVLQSFAEARRERAMLGTTTKSVGEPDAIRDLLV